MKGVEKVDLTVVNAPGVLGRVVGHIRREGWNIKKLNVDETEDSKVSHMSMSVEGTNTKLAQVLDRLLNLDCVLGVSMIQDGREIVRKRDTAARETTAPKDEVVASCPDKPLDEFRILVVNPGSTSTKFAVYDGETAVLSHTLRHDERELSSYATVPEQKSYRKKCIVDKLNEVGVNFKSIDAVVGCGGLLKPIDSGTYIINDAMLRDLHSAAASIHASALGAIIGSEIATELRIPAYVVDPIVVDEMDRNAKLSGMPGVERACAFHALNQKAVARRFSEQIGRPYENARLIVAHLGGGISVGAHRYGRVIDVNGALSGEGPFTPERTGAVPIVPIIQMCFSGEYTEAEMIQKIVGKGGLRAYLGTVDLRTVQKMINDGDEFAALVMDSMAYQVSKEIGSMTAVLEGQVDAILLTGGLAYSNRFTGAIKQRVDKMAPVYVFPGEDEMLALMRGALRVLRGEELATEYD